MPLLFQGVLVLVPGPVVRGIDHQGVFAQLEFVQNIKQAPGLVIELLHHVPVEPPLGFPPEAVGCVDDGVHHGVSQVEHEGLIRISLVL